MMWFLLWACTFSRPPATPPGGYADCRTSPTLDCLTPITGGSFLMGAQATAPDAPGYDPEAHSHEAPPRTTRVSSFWMRRNEIGTKEWARCVQSEACNANDVKSGGLFTAGDDRRNNHALNGITYTGAEHICAYLGGRLPTEAEWEYAARGPEARRYPWGAEPACGMRADVGKDLWGDGMTRGPCLHDDVPSMADARGESPFAVMAMAGGMLEWTSGGYATPDGLMPGFHVARGGSWTDEDPTRLRASARVPLPDTHQAIDVGVRCVFDDPD
ncbi:MAG: formylglycine-generating enzyme family protein [Myxococcota bacterium]